MPVDSRFKRSRGSHPRRWLRAVPFAAAVAAGAVAGACGGEAADERTLPPPLIEGRDIYRSRCATCHGRSGGGGTGPQLSDGRVAERYPDIAEHIGVVRDGRGAMPAWENRLTAEEIEAVVRYEREGL